MPMSASVSSSDRSIPHLIFHGGHHESASASEILSDDILLCGRKRIIFVEAIVYPPEDHPKRLKIRRSWRAFALDIPNFVGNPGLIQRVRVGGHGYRDIVPLGPFGVSISINQQNRRRRLRDEGVKSAIIIVGGDVPCLVYRNDKILIGISLHQVSKGQTVIRPQNRICDRNEGTVRPVINNGIRRFVRHPRDHLFSKMIRRRDVADDGGQ